MSIPTSTTLAPFLPAFSPSSSSSIPTPTPARLSALYASTSTQRQTNPTGYEMNAQWWVSVLEVTLRSGWLNGPHGDKLVIRVDDGLLGKLENGDGARPKGMGGVIKRLATSSPPSLHPFPRFLASPTPLHQPPSLTYRLVGRPLWWALSQLNPFASSSEKVEKEDVLWKRYGKGREYAHMPLLEQAAAAFTAYLLSHPVITYSSSLYDPSTFREQYGTVLFLGQKLSKRDTEVLLKWLSRDCGVVASSGDVIKLLEPGQLASDHPITEADRGTLTILQTLRRVEAQINDIESQITQSIHPSTSLYTADDGHRCQTKAKFALSTNQKPIATSHLRSKRAPEEILAKRLASSEQLTSVIRSIDHAKGDAEILAAYQTATSTLSTILKNPLLDLERIARTTDELGEAVASQEEMDAAVRAVGVGVGGMEIDEDELEVELRGLVEEERARVERERERDRSRAEEERKRAEEKAVEVEKLRNEEEGKGREEEKRAEKAGKKVEKRRIQVEAMARAKEEERADDEWKGEPEEAQLREREEYRRAEVDRLCKDEQRVAAE